VFANLIGYKIALNLAKYTSTSMVQMLGIHDLTLIPRQCLAFAEQFLPDLIGRYFLDKMFAKESVNGMKELIAIIKEAFHEILEENLWMDETTKAYSIKKLNAISENIAFPEYLSNDAELQEYYSQVFYV
jgi:predicted metalloendopeptidase